MREYRIWEYQKGRKPRLTPTIRAAAIEHYNTVLLSPTLETPLSHFDSNIVEKELSKRESEAANLLRKIESNSFSSRDKEALTKWLSIQITRVPCFREMILEGYRREGFQVSSAVALAEVNDNWLTDIESWEWTFLEAPADSVFVTSDNPVYFSSAGITYPLNPKLVLIVGGLGETQDSVPVNSELVEIVNRKTIENAHNYVFASKKVESLNVTVQDSLGASNLRHLRE